MMYFAYGSNMDETQMKSRCPSAQKIGVGQLLDYQLVFDGRSSTRNGAVCNIVSDANNSVWGILYEVASFDELDRYEGYPASYQRKELPILQDEGKTVTAIVYFREGKTIGEPSKEYRELVRAAAEKASFPERYILDFIDGEYTGVGLPKNFSSETCPHCGRKRAQKILYGDPVDGISNQDYFIQGFVPSDPKMWHCTVCSHEWGKNREYD